MIHDAWFPIGYRFPDGTKAGIVLFEGINWQIVETQGRGRTLIVHEELALRWLNAGLIEQGLFSPFEFGSQHLWFISCSTEQLLCPVSEGISPDTKAEALSFSLALKATREIDTESSFQDALYVERVSRLFPVYSISPKTADDVVLGFWLTGGANVSVKAFRRLRQIMSWLGPSQLKDVIEAAGFEVEEIVPADKARLLPSRSNSMEGMHLDGHEIQIESKPPPELFELAGRPELTDFFNEHIVDIVLHRDRYRALGINFPSAVILHGPPGTGKTFAVEQLVDFLGWPSFQIDASSVASPYIHETSKKVAEVFEKAMESAPSVLVIDEMEAFLADREMSSGHHRVEEVAEFLRRIPEATKREVLIIAMTNRIEIIDPAIQRRGRFDHVIKVDFASESEVRSLLDNLLSCLPGGPEIDTEPLARELAGRPLSDVAFVVRESARLAARSGKEQLDQNSLLAALSMTPARQREGGVKSPIGFI